MNEPPRDVLVLAGMMGTGKSRVAETLASRLGWSVLDLDLEIARRAGHTVPELFAREGETVFRQRERALVDELAAGSGLRQTVIATGGWTVGDPVNRSTFAALGTLVCLTATPATIAARLGPEREASRARPMLAGPGSLQARLGALLDARWSVYGAIPWQVATDARSPAEVAHRIEMLHAATVGLQPYAVPIAAGGARYTMLVGAGLLDQLGCLLDAAGLDGRVALISDPHVASLYGARVAEAMRRPSNGERQSADRLLPLEIGRGERAKTPETVIGLWQDLARAGFDRHATVVGLGGGVVTDTAGFAAAGLLRGIRWAAAPTTLLGMVDAAIGGKTGVNLAAGKNLAGAFWQPSLIVADPTTLATLEPEILREGWAEVVKAALIGDVALLEDLERAGAPAHGDWSGPDGWSALVARSASVKAAIVTADDRETEGGGRVLLNLGHTFAHAIERESRYQIRHGAAVAVGLVAAARLAEQIGIATQPMAGRVARLLRRLALPTTLAEATPVATGGMSFTAEALQAAMGHDKKRAAGRLRFVLPVAPGDVRLVGDVPYEAVGEVLRSTLGAG